MYKGQGRNQHELMTRAYWEFLVGGTQFQVPVPSTQEVQQVTRTRRPRAIILADSFSVARVRPRTSKGITDLLLLNLGRLKGADPSKKKLIDAGSQRIPGDLRRAELAAMVSAI